MERGLAIRFGGVEYGKEGEVVGGEVNPKVIMEMGKLPSSQYKGVVPQLNGRWGAQIYEQHQRVWLGTFDSEAEAAKSYDLAAIRFKGTEALTNFNPINITNFEEIMEDGMGSGVLDSGEREHMFDKVVTPSDVGKLNRLVIPKQHAEKYFPLDSTSNEKGLLLNFDDNTGKQWRFRYSYWNSSQSYVMTKGWSRFVKEKKLDAGDTVSFQRGVGQAGKNRFYIGWKRRPEPPRSAAVFGSAGSWGQFFWPSDRPVVQESNNFDYRNRNYLDYCKGKNLMVRPQQLLDLRSMVYLAPQRGVGVHGGEGSVVSPAAAAVFDSVPVVHERRGAKKHLRLFGVNLECPMDENRDGDGDGLSSPTGQQWFTQTASPSQLQLRLYNGASSQLPLPTVPQELTSKARPSWSFDLEP